MGFSVVIIQSTNPLIHLFIQCHGGFTLICSFIQLQPNRMLYSALVHFSPSVHPFIHSLSSHTLSESSARQLPGVQICGS